MVGLVVIIGVGEFTVPLRVSGNERCCVGSERLVVSIVELVGVANLATEFEGAKMSSYVVKPRVGCGGLEIELNALAGGRRRKRAELVVVRIF